MDKVYIKISDLKTLMDTLKFSVGTECVLPYHNYKIKFICEKYIDYGDVSYKWRLDDSNTIICCDEFIK